MYEGAFTHKTTRKRYYDSYSPDQNVRFSQWPLVQKARWLEENHDASVGLLDWLVTRTVTSDNGVIPLVKNKNGTPHIELNQCLKIEFNKWLATCEVTGEFSGFQIFNRAARTYYRDGEIFLRFIEGYDFDHESDTPLSLELIETECCPIDFDDVDNRVIQGVKKSPFGKPLGYYFYANHPSETWQRDYYFVPASEVLHLKLTRRIRQTRGVSIFHPVIKRIMDTDDYEMFERTAAKMAAALMGQIRRDKEMPVSTGQEYNPEEDTRDFFFEPGMFFDNLLPGEIVEIVNPNGRPNSGLQAFVNHNFKMISVGVGATEAAVTRNYDGSYSSERMKAIDAHMITHPRARDAARLVEKIYKRWIKVVILYGQIKIPKDVDLSSITNAIYSAPVVQNIDPTKDIGWKVMAIDNKLMSRTEVIRSENRDPEQTMMQIVADREFDKKYELDQQILGNSGKPPADTEQDTSSQQGIRKAA